MMSLTHIATRSMPIVSWRPVSIAILTLVLLDYYATGKLVPGVGADIVRGIAEGCRQAGCALIGGEKREAVGMDPRGRQAEHHVARRDAGKRQQAAALGAASPRAAGRPAAR
jgi:hypothetical protein